MIKIRPSALHLMTPALIERFHTYYLVADDECWNWRGPLTTAGYGIFQFGYQRRPAHRLSWELANGKEIPTDRVIDHLCRNRRCVNPEHLDVVTQRTNVFRSDAPAGIKMRRVELDGVCVRGHDLTLPDAWYHAPSGERRCQQCSTEVRKERYRKDRKKRGLPDFVRGRLCDVDGCEQPHYARGICKRHYNIQWRASRADAP